MSGAGVVGVGSEGGHELRGGGVVEELREWFVAVGEVAGEDRDPGGGVVVAPLDDPFEERAQQPEPARSWSWTGAVPAGPAGEPALVVLDAGG